MDYAVPNLNPKTANIAVIHFCAEFVDCFLRDSKIQCRMQKCIDLPEALLNKKLYWHYQFQSLLISGGNGCATLIKLFKISGV